MAYLSKYGVARVIRIPMPKAGVPDFAVGADWTPAAGDVKISKDGGAAANVTNLPTALVMGNGAVWVFSLTAPETEAAHITVTIVDAATKAVEDQAFDIETYGDALAQHGFDLDTTSIAQTGDAYGVVNSGAHGNAALKTIADGISAKTTNLPADPADASDISGLVGALQAFVDTEIQTIITQTGAPAIRAALGLAAADLDTQLGVIPTAAEIFTAVLTTQMTESYAAVTVVPSLAQCIFEVRALLAAASASGTILTTLGIDGVTPAATYDMDSASSPTSIVRAS